MYRFLVRLRDPSYRLVLPDDREVPAGVREQDWRLTRTRVKADVNDEVRAIFDREGYCLFRIGLPLSDLPQS
ncbi:hypothetical protein BRADO3664 [Bradyrhizobium sp. ORS 278]|uniref:hypothetical protein n=1 Tax=Bradyrhizobium sp. (strain ORS 278) TaxID=114615 RepID=UPI0001508014|nr:hypothetical protein [Bradyrhizobium sp. ORS 278]CAL77441.1 hypothetical protein BRADO3664 [Bradyrhizobium sp. ORS 278]